MKLQRLLLLPLLLLPPPPLLLLLLPLHIRHAPRQAPTT
jgi:hypothetical protein